MATAANRPSHTTRPEAVSGANLPCTKCAHQVLVGLLSGSSGTVTVATNIVAAEIAPSANVSSGTRRSAAASGSARNGSASIMYRGPGVQPPNGR
jgi:hypothetical protein